MVLPLQSFTYSNLNIMNWKITYLDAANKTESLAQTAIVFAGEKYKGLTVEPFNHTTI